MTCPLTCPYCRESTRVIKKGRFFRRKNQKNDQSHSSQRFHCRTCGRYFSTATGAVTYRQKRPELDQKIVYLLVSGVSQRRTAFLAQTTQTTVARKMVRLASLARLHHARYLQRMAPVKTAVFDDMETFEHSKLKPVSITLAVEEGSRRIIAVKAAQMPCKGKNADKARRRYGYRKDMRRRGLAVVLGTVSAVGAPEMTIKSDQCPRYPRAVRNFVPRATHRTFKGRRACVVGQGEMKAGGFDPLFSLNHTCAMYRDNTKRLSRRTWCTTKRIPRLQCLLDLYTVFHNEWIDRRRSFQRLLSGHQMSAPDPEAADLRPVHHPQIAGAAR